MSLKGDYAPPAIRGREQNVREKTGYVDQYRTLHVPVSGSINAQLRRNRFNCLENVGEGREVSLTLRLVGCVYSHRRTPLMRFPR